MTVKELREKLEGVPGQTPVALGIGGEFYNTFAEDVRLAKLELGYGPFEPMEEATRYSPFPTALYLVVEG